MPLLSQYSLPGEPTIVVIKADSSLQLLWECNSLGRNLFRTQKDDKIRAYIKEKSANISEIHNQLWPGQPVPASLQGRHDKAEDTDQEIWWRKALIPTSVAFSLVVWCFASPKRMPSDRQKARAFLQRVVNHILQAHGPLQFRVSCVGDNARESSAEISVENESLDSRILWTRRVHNFICQKWNANKLSENHFLSTSIERPSFCDVIFFALDLECQPEGRPLRSLAHSLLAQLAEWLNSNVGRVSTQPVSSAEARGKNKRIDESLLVQQVTEATMHLLHANASRGTEFKPTLVFSICLTHIL